jgi:hypothetical protein
MKNVNAQSKYFLIILTLAIIAVLNSQFERVFAQGTAFTYQGRLNNSNGPASGAYNFAFSLFSVPAGGSPVGSQVIANGVAVTNGLFMVTLDFGASPWNGETNWLLIEVETNGASSYTLLAPRQQLTPTPYAIYSDMASNLTGTVPVSQVSGTIPVAQLPSAVVTNTENGVTLGGTFNGNGGGLTNLNASKLASGVVPTTVLPNFQPPLYETIGGGLGNLTYGTDATVGGGATNTANGLDSTVGGGFYNTAKGSYGTVSGGVQNSVTNEFGTVGGGSGNVAGSASTVGGGQINTASGFFSFVGGGIYNVASGTSSFVGGGGSDGNYYNGNVASGILSAVVGGMGNQATNTYALVVGGFGNNAGGVGAFIGGGGYDGINYSGNIASATASVIGGGLANEIQTNSDYSSICGGRNNVIQNNCFYSTIGGGIDNSLYLSAYDSTIAGGEGNLIGQAANDSTIGGGVGNLIGAGSAYAAIGGGVNNTVSGTAATIPGGSNNDAAGNYSFAAGQQALALNQGAFVWADSQNSAFGSTANDQFLIRAQGGVGIGTAAPAAALNVASSGGIGFPQLQLTQQASDYSRLRFAASGYADWDIAVQNTMNFFAGGYGNVLVLQTNGNAIVSGTVTAHGVLLTSDRNAKENFVTLNPQTVLARVAALPVTQWNYKSDDPAQKHIGPMAQDFQAAFQLSDDDKHISVVDEGGVALAAIQGLNEKLETKSEKLEAENAVLREQLAGLKILVEKLASMPAK